MFTLTSWIYPVLTGCFLHASTVSCSPTGIYGTPLNLSSIHEWIYGSLIIFAGLTGAFLLLTLVITIASGCNFSWLNYFFLLATSGWFAHLVIYTIYVKNLYRHMYFPYPAYVASQTLDQLTDLFIVVGLLIVVYGRWEFRFSMGRSFFRHKWVLDTSLTILHAGAIGCTTAFLAFSAANPEDDNKHMQWLASYYVYTIVYILVVANAVFSIDLLRTRQGANQVVKRTAFKVVPIVIHVIFKVIMAIVYSQYKNPKINHDVVRFFEVIVLSITNLVALWSLLEHLQ